MRITRRAFWVVLLLVILVLAPTGALAQTGGVKVFSNGILLSGEWLKKWSSSPDPYLQYGMPLTGVIQSTSGENVVYLQKARFRETAEGIVVDPLGQMLYVPGHPANFSLNTPACRVHPETGFHLCYTFLQVYSVKGDLLGAPVSDPEEENGRIYQAFEFGWLEWRPENPPNQRVVFVDLGRIAYDLWEGGDVSTIGSSLPVSSTDITAFAFVEQSILPDNSTQTLYIIARDSKYQPISDVIVNAAVEFPTGQVVGLGVRSTDANGLVKYTFDVRGFQIGQTVKIHANLKYGPNSAEAGTSFRIWY